MTMRVRGFGTLCILALTAAPAIEVRAVQTSATPTGVLTGIVTDESGRPIVGARVQAVGRAKKWAGPYYEIPTGNPDESDDRGQFRLHSLPPGRYVVAVTVQSKVPAQAPTGYMRTYNPATTSLADAQTLVVEAGKEQSVSIRVTPIRFMEVSGVATTSTGEPAVNFDVWLRGGAATIGYTGVQGGT
jgi:Carboxypeptidase regulatory-like domain